MVTVTITVIVTVFVTVSAKIAVMVPVTGKGIKWRKGLPHFFKIIKVMQCLISQPCRNNGTCVNNIGDYTCVCRVGYTGKNCEISTYSIYYKPKF